MQPVKQRKICIKEFLLLGVICTLTLRGLLNKIMSLESICVLVEQVFSQRGVVLCGITDFINLYSVT